MTRNLLGGGGPTEACNVLILHDLGWVTLIPGPSPSGRREAEPCVVGVHDSGNVVVGQLAVDAVDEGAHLSGVNEEGLAATVAEPGELGDFLGEIIESAVFDGQRLRPFRMVPAEVFDEEIGKAESLEVFPGGTGIELGDHGKWSN